MRCLNVAVFCNVCMFVLFGFVMCVHFGADILTLLLLLMSFILHRVA